jgi:hypothetical protein
MAQQGSRVAEPFQNAGVISVKVGATQIKAALRALQLAPALA